MNTVIKKALSVKDNEHVVIFTKDKKKFNTSYFSSYEINYIQTEFTNDSKQVIVNQYKRIISVQLIETDKKSKHALLESLRKAGSQLTAVLNKRKVQQVTLTDEKLSDELLAFAEGICLANYQFLKYRKDAEKETHSLTSVNIFSKNIDKKQIERLNISCEATCKARDLVNEPQNFLTATQLAKEFQQLGKDAGFNVEVFNKAKIQSLKMGGLLAVNQGSIEPPTFTVMEYKPRNAVNKKPIVLVGKGVVYDTGGLSLKPTPNSMDYMKCDMAGSAIVGCVMYAIAKAKIPVHVIGLVPATDNRPDRKCICSGRCNNNV